MFLVTLGFVAAYIHRHKKAGGHCVPQPNSAVENVEMKWSPDGGPFHTAQVAPTQGTSAV
jgi:hypothetical protein